MEGEGCEWERREVTSCSGLLESTIHRVDRVESCVDLGSGGFLYRTLSQV